MQLEKWQIAKWWPAESHRPGYWERYKEGTREECEKFYRNTIKSSWHNGEKLVLLRINYTPVVVYEAEVSVKETKL